MAADPNDFIPNNDCVDGNCGMSGYFAALTSFKPKPMSTSILMAGKTTTPVVVGT